MNENASVSVFNSINCIGNVCANSSDMFQPKPPTSLWDFENVLYIGYISISFLIGIPGNMLIIIALISSKSRNNTDWYILFISLYGITGLLSEVPLSIIMKTTLWETIGFPNVCRVQMFFNYISQCAQALLFSGLSVERYRCISLSNNVRRNLHNRRGLFVSLILTVLVILFTTPIVVFDWDVANHDCTLLPGQKIVQTIFYGVLAATFFVLFTTSLVSYALVLRFLYKSKSRLSLIQTASSHPRRINIRPRRICKVGVAVTDASSTLTNRGGETSTRMNTKMFMLSNIRDKDTSVPLHSVKASALISSKISSGTGRRDFRPAICSPNVTSFSEQNNRIDLRTTANRSSSKTSNNLNKPNSSGWNGLKRTTFIIFLTTLIYIISWLPPIILAFIWSSTEHEYLHSRNMTYSVLFMRKSHFINNFTNPILYITLHTELRQRTKILLCGQY